MPFCWFKRAPLLPPQAKGDRVGRHHAALAEGAHYSQRQAADELRWRSFGAWMARLCPDAFPSYWPWQDRPDAFPKGPRTGKTPVRGNISPACIQIQLILARYARHASEKPRRAPLGNAPREHLAAKGRFRRPKPPNHARRTNLAALRWPCPCAGAPARATASRDRLSTAWPLLRGGAYPGAPPIPVTCQYLPPANACRLPCPLQPETSRR